jgi:hypothetical protein
LLAGGRWVKSDLGEFIAAGEKRALGVLYDFGGCSFEYWGGLYFLGSRNEKTGKQYSPRATQPENRLLFRHSIHLPGVQYFSRQLSAVSH